MTSGKLQQLNIFRRSLTETSKLSKDFKLFFSLEPGLKTPFYFSLILIFLNTVIISLSLSRLPLKVPLFYSLPWGEEQLVSKGMLWILPAGGLGIVVFNLLMAQFIFADEEIIGKIFVLSGLLVSLLTSYSLFQIVSLFI